MGSITTLSKERKAADGRPVKVTLYRAYIRRGTVSKSKVFERKTDAKRWINDNENTAALAAAAARSRAGTFGALVEAFVLAPPQKGTKFWLPSHLDFWKAELGDRNVAEISRGVINESRAKLQVKKAAHSSPAGTKLTDQTITPGTVNRYLATLSSVFNYAVQNEIVAIHPMKAGAVKKLTEGKGRSRILTEDEEARLYAAAEASSWPMMRLFLRMCLTTGARKSEVLGLRWKDVNLEDSVAVLTHTKNGSSRALPLVTDVKGALEEAKKVRPLHSDLVFYDPRKPTRPKNVDTIWKFVRERAGLLRDREDRLDQVVLHTTRHSVATKLIKNGANIAQVANITGHRTLSMLNRYTHLAAQDAVDLAQRVLAGAPVANAK